MSNLYHELSAVYEAMYQTFINYDEEYNYYHTILRNHHCTSVLEIGCGTGHLAKRFLQSNIDYLGIDMSEDMIEIAKKNTQSNQFMVADMRQFHCHKVMDAAIITGRTLSYLISNKDLHEALHAIHSNLSSVGLLVFDVIDAGRFIPSIYPQKEVDHYADYQGDKFKRKSHWKPNLEQNFCFDWASYYQQMSHGSWVDIGEDHSTIRTFTKDEIILFLTLSGYEVVDVMDRPSYAFSTLVFVAKKQHASLTT